MSLKNETINEKNYSHQSMIQWVNDWITEEAIPYNLGVLATVDQHHLPRSRVVCIREITLDGILFFTQKSSKKVQQIDYSNHVSLTIALPTHRRQITFQGQTYPLLEDENNHNSSE